MPEDEPTVATVVILLLQVPPATELLSVALLEAHKPKDPLIAPGSGFTVIARVVEPHAVV